VGQRRSKLRLYREKEVEPVCCWAIAQVANFFNIADAETHRKQSGKRYAEFLRVPAMSAGIYVLPSGGTDPQSPHKEDEMYYVVRGQARMRVGTEDRAVSEGSIIFVPAREEHRFYEITEELTVLVFFAPAETE
jgi:mannose-6-phosphate isomerase-like protein (cupin superfamily)